MTQYVAFLRGINVGGRNPMKMADLRETLASSGLEAVKTVLASGNVVFETPLLDRDSLPRRIDQAIEDRFGKKVGVTLRTIDDLRRLADVDPFKDVEVTPQTRLNVTFLAGEGTEPAKGFGEPSETGFEIVHATATEICSVLTLSPDWKTTDFMARLEKAFGHNITTRNWNTVAKILALATH